MAARGGVEYHCPARTATCIIVGVQKTMSIGTLEPFVAGEEGLMSVTITLREELADDLARQAQARRMSLEQWATRILEAAVSDDGGRNGWTKLNSRRLALISKEYETGLTDAEAAELAFLQDAAAKACEPQDRKLSGCLSALEQEADYPSALPHE